jgi:hypothetical protein
MPTPIWEQSYAPAEATRGMFIPLDMSDTATYPLTGRGKYAQLTYDVGGAGSPGQPPISAVITQPVSINGVISADLIEIDNLFFTSPISSHVTQIDLINKSIYQNLTLTANTSSNIIYSPIINLLEVFNDDTNNKIYLAFETMTFAQLTSQGLAILPEVYYSIERDIAQVTIGTVKGAAVRVIGHKRI